MSTKQAFFETLRGDLIPVKVIGFGKSGSDNMNRLEVRMLEDSRLWFKSQVVEVSKCNVVNKVKRTQFSWLVSQIKISDYINKDS